MIVLSYSIHGKQCGGQVHLFRKEEKRFKKSFVSQFWRFGKGAQRSLERSGSDIPALRPNHDYVPTITRRKESFTFPFPKHVAALLETVPEPPNSFVGLTSNSTVAFMY